MRWTGEGKDRLYSLIDMTRLVSGKNRPDAGHDVQELEDELQSSSEVTCDGVTSDFSST